MKPESLASCENCWFNGLQHGSIGLSLGYCTEHKVVLRRPSETTCARHMRKDLLLDTAVQFSERHKKYYQIDDQVQKLVNYEPASETEYVSADTSFIRSDSIGEALADYGEYGTKIESLSNLRTLRNSRAELAMLSLARGYTHRCMKISNNWKSGIHILWWTRRRLAEGQAPEIYPADIRYSTTRSLERQVELAAWSLLMFRLVFISDIGRYAAIGNSPLAELESIAEIAAEETESPNLGKLLKWIRKRGMPILDNIIPEKEYHSIALSVKREDD